MLPSPPWRLESHDGVASLSGGDAVVVLWRSGASVPRIRWVRDRARAVAGPDGILVLQLLLPTATPPGVGELSEIRRGLQEIGPRARSLALLPLGDGRWQALVRTLLRAGLAMTRRSDQIVVVGSLAGAFDLWRGVASEVTPGADELERALAGLFAAVGAPPPGRGW